YADGRIAGYPAPFTNQVTLGDYFFGNWRDLLIGMWGGLDLLVDPYTASNTGTVRIVGLQSMDIAVRHGQSFAFENDTA
ncbi:MAG: phage major capsid protein, partial [Deltaproteobacteria bacterium]|nr:phage major capsid protein [Deltaproteobacteria bacterium]